MVNNLEKINQNNNISTLLASLKKKVKNFAVIDKEGQFVGKIKDLVLDANQRLNLVVNINHHYQESTDKYHIALLRSQKIKKIDNLTKTVLIDMDKSEIKYMPENLETETPDRHQKVEEMINEQLDNSQTVNTQVESDSLDRIKEEYMIRLLEERLLIDSKKRKIGEVIVRKEIETRMMQVPVRREKLIIEQVSPESKQLAEIDLGQGEISGVELIDWENHGVTNFFDGNLTVSGEFSSAKIASLLLNAIALERHPGYKLVKVAITVEDESLQRKYQEWFDRCSQGQSPKAEK